MGGEGDGSLNILALSMLPTRKEGSIESLINRFMADTFEVRDHRNKAMFRVDDEIVDKYARKIGITALNVYLYLCRHADRNQESFPSQEYLSEKIGVSVRSVQRAISTLQKFNIISVSRNWRTGTQRTNNTYTLLDKSVWMEAPDKTVVYEAPDILDTKHTTNETISTRHHGYTKVTHRKVAHKKVTHLTSEHSSQIPEVIKLFESVDPKNKLYYGNKTQREAVGFLLDEYGFEEVQRRILVLPRVAGLPYFPIITTPVQLRDKWVALETQIQKHLVEKEQKKDIVAF